jgi:hypothetical protein
VDRQALEIGVTIKQKLDARSSAGRAARLQSCCRRPERRRGRAVAARRHAGDFRRDAGGGRITLSS